MPGDPPVDDSPPPDELPSAPPRLEDTPEPHPPAQAERWRALRDDIAALLRNRFILGGLGGLAVLLLIAAVLVAVGGENGDGQPSSRALSATPQDNGSDEEVREGMRGQVRITTTVRNGPDLAYVPLGLIPRGAVVGVVGRNEDESWLQVIYPPGTDLLGWIRASFIAVDGDLTALAVSGPTILPEIAVPTSDVIPIEEPILPELPTVPVVLPTEPVVIVPTDTPRATLTLPPPPTDTPRVTLTLVVPPTNTPPPPGGGSAPDITD